LSPLNTNELVLRPGDRVMLFGYGEALVFAGYVTSGGRNLAMLELGGSRLMLLPIELIERVLLSRESVEI